jgi:hypothetical protein
VSVSAGRRLLKKLVPHLMKLLRILGGSCRPSAMISWTSILTVVVDWLLVSMLWRQVSGHPLDVLRDSDGLHENTPDAWCP